MLRRLTLGLCLVALSCPIISSPAIALAPPPSNDDFDDAKVISSLPFRDRLNPRQATTASDDPGCHGRDKTVWYSYTPPSMRWIRAETPGSRYDTTLSVYSGTRGNLTQLICDDDTGNGPVVTVRLQAGVPYHLMVGAERADELGRLIFRVERSKPACLDRKRTIVGTDGNDTLVGTRKRDVIVGLGGDDSIKGRGGRDVICGGAGDDSISGRGLIEGEDGDDDITTPARALKDSTINGGNGNDEISGALGPDRISGGAGTDSLDGGRGKDYLLDESIDVDQLFGGPGRDLLQTGKGNDAVDGGRGRDFLRYGEDVRALNANLTTGVISFDTFTQTIVSVEGLQGTEVQDTIVGSPRDDQLFGGGHVDTISGMGGDDEIYSGDSGGTFTGGDGDDLIFVREGFSQVSGDDGDDVIEGGVGEDTIEGGLGDDVVTGGLGPDTLGGGEDDDEIFGGRGADHLAGDSGDDLLRGSKGNDELDGGDGNDWLDGGANTDSCTNGERRNRCEA